MLPYDSSALNPLIIYDPRSPSRGKQLKNESVVGNIDFVLTILDLAGLEVPKYCYDLHLFAGKFPHSST
tara:strand:- start:203 stop:409 length:207 start_codon:yes stop_codon:yes gene_type:complete